MKNSLGDEEEKTSERAGWCTGLWLGRARRGQGTLVKMGTLGDGVHGIDSWLFCCLGVLFWLEFLTFWSLHFGIGGAPVRDEMGGACNDALFGFGLAA